MVLPDGTKSDQNRPGRRRALLFAVAALAIVAGFVALGSLSPSDPVAVDTTTTTTLPEVEAPIDLENFSVSQIATGPPLEWERVAGSTTGYPLAVTEHQGSFYLFASVRTPNVFPGLNWLGSSDQGPAGLVTWRSGNGENWERMGETVIDPGYMVANVVATSSGFVAAGATPGGNELIVWRSNDGVEWTMQSLPTDADSQYLTPRPTALTATDERTVVAGVVQLDRNRLLTEHLKAAGIDLDISAMQWDTRYAGEDGVELTVRAPLGIPVLTTTLQELGLNETERDLVTRGRAIPDESHIWVVDRTGEWEWETVPFVQVRSLSSLADGAILASGLGGAGLDTGLVSTDGVEWTPAEDGPGLAMTTTWGDSVVGVTSGFSAAVSISTDGHTWEETKVSDLLPHSFPWYPGALGAGPEGFALSVQGLRPDQPPAEPAPQTLPTENGTLIADHGRGVLELEIDGQTHIWDLPRQGSSNTPDGIGVDLSNRVVLLQDPHTGETLAEVGFEELNEAISSQPQVRFSDVVGHHALLYTRDGTEWEIRDARPITADESAVTLIEVGEGKLIATTLEPPVDPRRAPPTGFEIWSAPLP